jgi:hypothetical protein
VTIYIDDAKIPYKRMLMCHMMTDGDMTELHQFAQGIGLKQAWFQNCQEHPHYDLALSMRTKALEAGAVAISTSDMIRLCT